MSIGRMGLRTGSGPADDSTPSTVGLLNATLPPPAPNGVHTAAGPTKKKWHQQEFFIGKAVKPEIVMNFSRQASSFLKAGIPILEALSILGEESTSKKMIEVLAQIGQSLRSGGGFADAVAQHPKVFPGYFIQMVHSAELTGNLPEVLDQLSGYIERDVEARRQVKSALTYPTFVLGLAVVAVVVFGAFVLPKFKGLYSSLGAKLPLPTRMLLAFTDFMQHSWYFVLAGFGLLVLAGYGALGGEKGKQRRDKFALRMPVLGSLFNLIAVERFCRVLAALASAGVSLPEAVEVAGDSTNNRVFQSKLRDARQSMVRGAGLSGPLTDTGLFPPAARQMIRVGESTGSLDIQLASAAQFYSRELTYRLKKATDLFEPIVIVGVGFVVGFVAVAQISAMYSIFKQVKV